MSGKLTTHVLDTANGKPAAGMGVTLSRLNSESGAETGEVFSTSTNADGRVDGPLLEGDALLGGTYELRFSVGDYFAGLGHADARRFLDVVPIMFVVDDVAAHYHVPLLVSPWSYSTYRGS